MTKEINVAVIGGAGWIGGVHSECFIRLKPLLPDVDIKLHTIVDIQKESVKAAAEKYGFKEWSTDYNKVIETDEIDIVDICVNNNLHKDIAVKAAEAGKHIICEKPLSTNSIEGKEMCQAVEKNNVKNMINFNYRKIPAVAFIKEMINNGDIGNIYNYRCFIGQDFAVDPNMPITWRFKKETAGGGSLLTMGSHVIDLARYLAGEIEEVVGMSETFIKERPISGTNKREKVDVDDSTSFMAKFRNGAIGTF